jgi:two-component system NarL family sensor kinase
MVPLMTESPEIELLEARAVIQHLQDIGESIKARIARKLHDDIQGLMIAAVMDLAAAAAQLPSLDIRAQQQLARANSALQTAISSGRELMEELRPSLLDNVGLFTALKWKVQRVGEGMKVIYTESYPEMEPLIPDDVSVAMFRIAEEALAMTLKRGAVDIADLAVHVDQRGLHMRFTDNGVPTMLDGREQGSAVALAAMRYRLRLLGGTVDIEQRANGNTILTARVPL